MDVGLDKSPRNFATGSCLGLASDPGAEGNVFKITPSVTTLKRGLFIREAPLVFKTREGHMFCDSGDCRSPGYQQIRRKCSPGSAH